MKSVLISIQPKWCELIASGKKTIEVRKTVPKLKTPFKCYIYDTKGTFDITLCPDLSATSVKVADKGRGKVIGEFVCDKVFVISNHFDKLSDACLTLEEFYVYEGNSTVYGWHISDLKIYDTPKELGEFYSPNNNIKCEHKQRGYNMDFCTQFENGQYFCKMLNCDKKKISRPPQSWCYVEEV